MCLFHFIKRLVFFCLSFVIYFSYACAYSNYTSVNQALNGPLSQSCAEQTKSFARSYNTSLQYTSDSFEVLSFIVAQ